MDADSEPQNPGYAISPNLNYMYGYIYDIYGSSCGTNAGVNGQEFDSDNYNVIVYKAGTD